MIQRTLALSILALLCVGCVSFQGPGPFIPEVRSPTSFFEFPVDMTFDWPVSRARLTQKFKHRARRPHYGIDLASRRGAPIFSAAQGLVIYASNGFRGYGNLVIVEHRNRWATFYSHLDRITVRAGDYVRQGQEIGSMGRTGNATGTHLHFETRRDRTPVDPLKLIKGTST